MQGTGQLIYAVPAGDGFVTDTKVINQFKGKKFCTPRYCIVGAEDPNFFFKQLMTKPYAQNIVWGPHFYAQSVIPVPLPKQYMEVSPPRESVSCSMSDGQHNCPKSFTG